MSKGNVILAAMDTLDILHKSYLFVP